MGAPSGDGLRPPRAVDAEQGVVACDQRGQDGDESHVGLVLPEV